MPRAKINKYEIKVIEDGVKLYTGYYASELGNRTDLVAKIPQDLKKVLADYRKEIKQLRKKVVELEKKLGNTPTMETWKHQLGKMAL